MEPEKKRRIDGLLRGEWVPTREEVLQGLRELAHSADAEIAHDAADWWLIAYLYDPEIEGAWRAVPKWYA